MRAGILCPLWLYETDHLPFHGCLLHWIPTFKICIKVGSFESVYILSGHLYHNHQFPTISTTKHAKHDRSSWSSLLSRLTSMPTLNVTAVTAFCHILFCEHIWIALFFPIFMQPIDIVET